MRIVLVRHGESQANTGNVLPHEAGDYGIALTDAGCQQAREAGRSLDSDFLRRATHYVSPYVRTCMTWEQLMQGAGVDPATIAPFQDPLLREQDRGYAPEAGQMAARRTHGWFWYRHSGGESPADVYLRASVFLDSLFREHHRSGQPEFVIVSHGMFIRCFVMRYLHLTHEQFLSLANPGNAAIITLDDCGHLAGPPLFENDGKGVLGLHTRSD